MKVRINKNPVKESVEDSLEYQLPIDGNKDYSLEDLRKLLHTDIDKYIQIIDKICNNHRLV